MSFNAKQLLNLAIKFEKFATEEFSKNINKCSCDNIECPHGQKACLNDAVNDKKFCTNCAKHLSP